MGEQTNLALAAFISFLVFCNPPLSPQPPFHPRRGGKGELHLTSRFGDGHIGRGCDCFWNGRVSGVEFRAPGGLRGWKATGAGGAAGLGLGLNCFISFP